MTCPHCNAQLTAEARFCPACGKAADAPRDLVGREIAGRYRIVKKLGEGGMGAVYRGEQISLKRAVAVKVLKPELGSNQMVLRRFNAEAEAVAKLSHPNTVNIYDFGQDSDGALFIAMEFIEGRSLREVIQKEGPFSPTRAVSIALQVAASLTDAHAHSIVHRDLKPDNVMLQERGRNKDVVRVLDFGIAKLRDENRATQQAMTQAGDMLGTPQYMAPEQIRGEAIDGRCDIYALGCMIYEMVTGSMVYEAPTVMAMLSKHLLEAVVPPSQRRRDLMIPPSIDHLVLHAMQKDPNQRPPSMELFHEMLQTVLASLPRDPNRSAGMSVQQAVATPAAPSSFQGPVASPPYPTPGYPGSGQQFQQYPTPGAFPPPSTPPPSHGAFAPPSGPAPTPAPPQTFAPPTPPPTAASTKSRAPIWIALGVIALAGAGVGVWFATREPTKTTENEEHAQPVEPEEKEGSDEKEDNWAPKDEDHEAPPAPAEDHWAPQGGTSMAKPVHAPKPVAPKRSIGTDKMPIPAGAKLRVGAGFTSQVTDEGHVHLNVTRGILIALAPLDAGTNDPTALARKWTSQTGVTATGRMKVMSAGKQRTALGFVGEVNGEPVNQVVVLYIEPAYRLGVLYQAPSDKFTENAFQREVMSFFAKNVVLPSGD